MKKSKLIIGIALICQSFTCFILFVTYFSKKKDLAKTFFALGLAGGIAATYALYLEMKERKEYNELAHDYCYGDECDCFDDGCADCYGDYDDIDVSFENENTVADDNANID